MIKGGMTKAKRKRFKLKIKLKRGEIEKLKRITGSGIQTAKRFRRALLLLLMNEGKGAKEASLAVGVVEGTARRVGHRYMKLGFEAALNDEPRPGKKRLLSAKQSQRIVAMVCGPPPEGLARWSTAVIAEEAN